MDQGGDTPAVPYAVLPEKKTGAAGAMMGSTHVYDIAAVWIYYYSMLLKFININILLL